AAAAMLALPIRNWGRDGEESSRPALAGSSGVVRSIVDISPSSLRGSTIVLRGLVARPRFNQASWGEVSPLRLRQAQALQPGSQCARVHVEDRGRPPASLDTPTRGLEHLPEVRALVPFEGLEAARRTAGSRCDRCRGRQQRGANVYHAPPREHAGPLDHVL